jgi:imidazole glycerol-phosphate synthase subunit HisH
MKVALVKYNAGNVLSVGNALRRLGVDYIVTDDPSTLAAADKVIFPGVGEASSALRYLQSRGLDRVICGLCRPVLGICLGLQLLCRRTEENDTPGLGIFPVTVKRFRTELKVPHIGWNGLRLAGGPLWQGLSAEPHAYFVHSYRAEIDSACTIAITDYGEDFSSALARDNFFAVQFHPEKSGAVGRRILTNFLEL